MEGDIAEGNRDESVSDPVESKKLVFDNLVRASFVVPGALVHSVRLDSYVSLRPNWYLPRWKARMLSERLEWIELKTLYKDFGTDNLWPDMMIHVADERPEELKLVADNYHLARPEIIIEFMEEDGWWDAERVGDILRHNTALNPRLGSYVISRVEVPPEAFKPLEAAPAPAVTTTSDTSVTTAEAVPPPHMARPLSLAALPASVHVLSAGYDMRQAGAGGGSPGEGHGDDKRGQGERAGGGERLGIISYSCRGDLIPLPPSPVRRRGLGWFIQEGSAPLLTPRFWT